MRTALLLILFIAGCAGTAPRPQTVLAPVSQPCAALAQLPEIPALTPLNELQALGRACFRDNDEQACYVWIQLIAAERAVLAGWAVPAAAAIKECSR
jgi:hypothetical protein